jgi:hypothetical protein
MKNIKCVFNLVIMLFISAQLLAQAPEKFNYQAVCRDSTGNIIANQAVDIRTTIHNLSPTGFILYQETHSVITNTFGLINIAVGGGTVVSGDFAIIPWGNGEKYLQIEINTGSMYQDVGTTQILSVPYALHARSADSALTLTEADPVFSGSVAGGITGTDTAYWNHKQDTISVGIGLTKTNNVISAKTYSIGNFVNGGIVFWVDETTQHGLVCEKGVAPMNIAWAPPPSYTTCTRANGDGPLAGEMNTVIIIAVHAALSNDGSGYAARYCNELQVTEGGITYGDWYLPSAEELNLLYQNKSVINATALAHGGTAFQNHIYWSSTEDSSTNANCKYFVNGINCSDSKNSMHFVRPVRRF